MNNIVKTIWLIFLLGFASCYNNNTMTKQEIVRKSIIDKVPIGAYVEITNQSQFFLLSSKKMADSTLLFELTLVNRDTSIANITNGYFYISCSNNKIIGGYDYCDSNYYNDSTQCTIINDSVVEISLKYKNSFVFRNKSFKKLHYPLQVNDGMLIDPDYFFRLKSKKIPKYKMQKIKFYTYPSNCSNTTSMMLSDNKEFQFLTNLGVFCEGKNKFIYVGFVNEVINTKVFKNRYTYEREYWLPVDTFYKYFEHW